MRLIEQYEKDGIVIDVNSLLTTSDAVIDIKQIMVMNNEEVLFCFDTVEDRIIMTQSADAFIAKYKDYLGTLEKKAAHADTGCGCKSCK
ncbi:hypothetical protein [Flavobacterium sp. WV_118_3]|jgi:hypothetical protein|uniref:hypothetical protein n=1 Tax=Flavobacterium sp. WV_118_3 TaxID=3151764 RepID=UPI0012D229EE|nr:hypothetical protein [Flavobacterium sp.]HRB73016.1 hypothetical protein [Flavobacterium sp.]